jgi:hypothetical protein
MPAPTLNKPNVIGDPGYLYYAPIGTTLPTNTVTGSVFTDAWTAPWVWLGMTTSGSVWHYNLTTANVDAAEIFDPVNIRTTGRTASVSFTLMDYTASRLAVALNGATKTVTGATTTTMTKVTPPQPGSEIRFMVGWESNDFTVRKIAYQCINSGDIAETFAKAPATADVPFSAQCEISATYLTPFETYFAGVARG